MCTHRVNFYLQYTIYNLLYLISSSEEHYTFCFNNSRTQSNFSGSRYVKCAPAFRFSIKGSIVCQFTIHSFNQIKGKAANEKCFKCSHIFLASWILKCGELKSNSRFVCFIYCTGSHSGTCKCQFSYSKLPSEKSCKAMVNSIRNTQRKLTDLPLKPIVQ